MSYPRHCTCPETGHALNCFFSQTSVFPTVSAGDAEIAAAVREIETTGLGLDTVGEWNTAGGEDHRWTIWGPPMRGRGNRFYTEGKGGTIPLALAAYKKAAGL